MKIKQIINFFVGLLGLGAGFILLPKIHSCIPGSEKLQQTIKKENIEVNALFYSEETSSAGSKKAIEEKLEEINRRKKKQ